MRLALDPNRMLVACGVLLALGTAPASAGDVTLSATGGLPTDSWGLGWAGALSSSWFEAVSFEGEVARVPVDLRSGNLTTFTASALISPPFGRFTPYGGVGFGLFRQTLGDASDTGRVRALILGLKVRLGIALAKAEYREIDLSGEPLVDMERRVSAGLGITF